jgi:hypothetical protein
MASKRVEFARYLTGPWPIVILFGVMVAMTLVESYIMTVVIGAGADLVAMLSLSYEDIKEIYDSFATCCCIRTNFG